MWGVLHYFDGFMDHIEVLVQILLAHAFQTQNNGMALLLRAVCSTGDRLFKESISSQPPPCLGDGNWPLPLFACFKDKLAWTFARCHFCLRKAALHRCAGLIAFDDAKEYTTLACENCVPRGCVLLLRTPIHTASMRVMFSKNSELTIMYVKDILESSNVSARHIGSHVWSGRVQGKLVSRRVLLTAISIDRQDGGKPLQIQIPLLKAHHDAAFGKGAIRKSTVNNFGPIFTNVLLKGGGHAIVDRVLSWPTFTSPRTGRKQKGTPIRLQCTHRYCKPFRGAVLKSCTFCGC